MGSIKFIILFSTFSFCQIQYGGSPRYLLHNEEIKYYNVDHSKIIENTLHPMVLKYANEYIVDIDILNEAETIQISDEIIYYIGIQSLGAKALGLVFNQFHLTENSEMFIYSSDKSMHIGSFNEKNNNQSGKLETAVVKGEKVIIELSIPIEEVDGLRLKMKSIMHDFIDLMKFQV